MAKAEDWCKQTVALEMGGQMTPRKEAVEEDEVESTPGPWHAYNRGIGWEIHAGSECSNTCEGINNQFRDTFKEGDAKLIASIHALQTHAQALADALDAIKFDPYGCVYCDSGKLRNPQKQHQGRCGFAKMDAALAAARKAGAVK